MINQITANLYLLIFLLGACHLSGQPDTSVSSYSVKIDAENMTEVQIEWNFTLLDSVLYMAPGANQFPNRWGNFIQNLKAQSQSGKPVIVELLSGGQWKVNAPLYQRINLSYTVKINHEDYKWSGGVDGVAYVREWGVFCAGRSLFVMNGEPESLKVDFDIPSGWKISCSWLNDDQEDVFKVDSNNALVNAMFFAGTHEELRIKREGFELVFALGGPSIIAQKQAFVDLAEGVLDYYVNLFGGIPIPPPGQSLQKAMVIMNSGNVTDGEVLGNDISILLEPDGDEMAQMISRFIFAHEFFHLWNGKTFIPEQDNVEWFKEGFTNYYTLKSLYKVGVLNEKSYFDMLGQFFYARYNNDDGVGQLTMTDGSLKHDHWGLIYAGGLFVAIIQDIQIREASKNQKSIDDLMRQFYQKYHGTNERYTIDDLQNTLSELNGNNQKNFFQNYIIGTQRLPFIEYLNQIGLTAKMENDQLNINWPEQIPPHQRDIISGLLGS